MKEQINENYRPANVEFDVANASIVPDQLGRYESGDEAAEFMHKHLLAINQKLCVYRFMDQAEKSWIRSDYNDLLENKIPMLEKDLQKAKSEFETAKKELADSMERVNATTNEAKALALSVKRGIKEINLDDQYTWRVPFNGVYYFFTWMDKVIKLCKTQVIPEYEKMDVFNASQKNEEFFFDNEPSKEDEQSNKDNIRANELLDKIGTQSE